MTTNLQAVPQPIGLYVQLLNWIFFRFQKPDHLDIYNQQKYICRNRVLILFLLKQSSYQFFYYQYILLLNLMLSPKYLGIFWLFGGVVFSIISREGTDIQQPIDKTAK